MNESTIDCCGIAGTYGSPPEKYAISMVVGKPLFEFIDQAGSELVICDSETCRWQIAKATGQRVIHPVEILAWSYGYEIKDSAALDSARTALLEGRNF